MSDRDPTTRSYVPGEWYAVLGPSLVLALPPDRRDLAAAAWARAAALEPRLACSAKKCRTRTIISHKNYLKIFGIFFPS